MNKVSVVIPHAGGEEMLAECLEALIQTQNVEIELIIVVNGTTEVVEASVVSAFKEPKVLYFEGRIGFAGACNRGVDSATSNHVFLLNNDAVVEPDTISILLDQYKSQEGLAACQPRLLSARKVGKFDYSSAAGGEMDRFGFPFAHGRIFDTVEDDKGQYTQTTNVFWGAGAALLIERKAYQAAGGLEERFFAHMEEIDLCWRFHLMGKTVMTVPAATVYHAGAVTIKEDSFMKMYLNHRNSQAMLLRNYSIGSICRFGPIRELMDLILAIRSLLSLDLKRFWAVVRAKCWILFSLHYLIISRKNVQRLRTVNEKAILNLLYPRSVVWDYFILKRQTWDVLRESWKRS